MTEVSEATLLGDAGSPSPSASASPSDEPQADAPPPDAPPPDSPQPVSPPPTSPARRAGLVPVVAASVLSALLSAGVVTVLDRDQPTAASPATVPADVVPADAVPADAGAAAVAAAAVAPAVVQIETGSGVGSGVVYSDDGLVLTVAHVVGSSRQVSVRVSDGRTVQGTVVGADEATDIAVIRIPRDSVVAVADLALGEQPQVGQLTVAVGSPFGLDQTVTSGIVSAVDRVVNGLSMVQTDAAINPGNSGGPLVDASGRVLGLNDVIFTGSGDNAGVGFAISIDLARIVADQLVAGRTVGLALLGVSTGTVADGSAGAQVVEVVPGSAAAAAGLEVGDVIVGIDGTTIADSAQLRARVITRAPGTDVDLEVVRDGASRTVTATLGSTA